MINNFKWNVTTIYGLVIGSFHLKLEMFYSSYRGGRIKVRAWLTIRIYSGSYRNLKCYIYRYFLTKNQNVNLIVLVEANHEFKNDQSTTNYLYPPILSQ